MAKKPRKKRSASTRDRSVEDELMIRPARSRDQGSSSAQNVPTSWGALKRRADRLSISADSLGSGSWSQQRVVVKASYVPHPTRHSAYSALQRHADYLGRESAGKDDDPNHFYDHRSDQINGQEVMKGWEQDPRHFRFIVSPEYGQQIDQVPGGLRSYIRQWVAQTERDLGRRLEWVAVNHHDTDDLHTHVVVRGIDRSGQEVHIPKHMIQKGLRGLAQDLATSWIGQRNQRQVGESLSREVAAHAYTSLDRRLDKCVRPDQIVDYRLDPSLNNNRQLRLYLDRRLEELGRMGLAERVPGRRWALKKPLGPPLQAMAQRAQMVGRVAPVLGRLTNQLERYRPAEDGREFGGIVRDMGLHSELKDESYVVVQDSAGKLRYAVVMGSEWMGLVERGGVVQVSDREASLARTDRAIAEVAQANDGVYTTNAHNASLPAYFAVADRDSYFQSIQRRLGTLARLKCATQQDGAWLIHDPKALASGERATTRPGYVSYQVVAGKSLASQVQAHAVTWLDRMIYRQSLNKDTDIPITFEIKRLAGQRKQWMVEQGYAQIAGDRYELKQGAFDRLHAKEIESVSRELEAKHKVATRELLPAERTVGQYEGTLQLHAGTYLVVCTRTGIVLAPVSQAPPLPDKSRVQVVANQFGKASVRPTRAREHEQGRG